MGNISTKYARGEQVRSENAVTLRKDLHGPEDAETIRQGLDGPEDAVTIRQGLDGPEEEVDESEERVTRREESNSINSNEQVVERHTEQNLTGANTKGLCNRNRLVGLIIVLAVLLVAALVALTALAVNIHFAKRNAESLATQVLMLSTDLNADLRISTENISCERPSCIICKTEVMPHFEALHCAVSVKNGSCIMCGGKCMILQGLLDKVKQNATHACKKPKIELNCCILAIVGNLSHHCEGGYLCYNKIVHDHHNQSVHEPVCRCPPGSRSEHCKKPYTEAADCRCFRSTRKFCGQKQITHCDNVNWSTCHMTRSELGEQYNCLCNKSTGTDDHSAQCTPSDSDSTKDLG
ncbi:uncharacterized protein LOC123523464 [Mercenaria mercenaria]|uniref:uncharacterized protein LOC123523464 n=1 Tax=Mercenaria mercenaria TaxID=6596 RepID=UPI00234F3EA5|nr:uncharacterized protein LOC123523464 [Mercenaria mercenaria]